MNPQPSTHQGRDNEAQLGRSWNGGEHQGQWRRGRVPLDLPQDARTRDARRDVRFPGRAS